MDNLVNILRCTLSADQNKGAEEMLQEVRKTYNIDDIIYLHTFGFNQYFNFR